MESASDVLDYLQEKKHCIDSCMSAVWVYDRNHWNTALLRASCPFASVMPAAAFARDLFNKEELEQACLLLIDRTRHAVSQLAKQNLHIRNTRYDDMIAYEHKETETVFRMSLQRNPSSPGATLKEGLQRLKSSIIGEQSKQIETFVALQNEPLDTLLLANHIRWLMSNAIFIRLIGPMEASEMYFESIKQ